MADLTGQVIHKQYEVREFLGRGGMADVYKVWDNQRSAYLAMKVLREDLAEDNVFLRRFRREAASLGRLQHPHIVRFYDLAESGDLVFLIMELVEGITLRKEISRIKAPFSMERIMEVMTPACSALQYAHNMGMAHCDVKPANIMIHKNGMVYLGDFGIARMTEGATTMTMAGAGTPAYMAPEQIRGEEPLPQSDIYSLGIVLYEMLTGGERPFTGEQASITGTTGEKLRWEKMNLAPKSPREYNSQISRELEAVVMKCLERDANRRYADALDLLEAIQRCMPSQTPAVRSQPVPEPEQRLVEPHPAALGKTPKPGQKFQWWQFALGGALLVIVLLLLRPGGTPSLPEPTQTIIVMPTNTPEPIIALEKATATEVSESTLMHTPMPTSTPEPTFTQTPSLGIGSTQVSPKDGMVMMYVPAGDFIMGSQDGADEKPVHTVYLDAYWIDRTEVTNAMYRECVEEGGCTPNEDWGSEFNGSQQPVVGVDWNQAQAYCTWAGRELPTEAQWEKAARGEEGRTYPWGEGIDGNKANYNRNIGRTTDVGSYPGGESPYGVMDMAGNVWEWVADWYASDYYSTQTEWNNPSGPESTGQHVVRGGSWHAYENYLRTSDRNRYFPYNHYNILGFRCLSSHP